MRDIRLDFHEIGTPIIYIYPYNLVILVRLMLPRFKKTRCQ